MTIMIAVDLGRKAIKLIYACICVSHMHTYACVRLCVCIYVCPLLVF